MQVNEDALKKIADGLFESSDDYITLYRKDCPNRITDLAQKLIITVESNLPRTKAGLHLMLQDHQTTKTMASALTSFSHTEVQSHIAGNIYYQLQITKQQLLEHFIKGNDWEKELLLLGEAVVESLGTNNYRLISAAKKPSNFKKGDRPLSQRQTYTNK